MRTTIRARLRAVRTVDGEVVPWWVLLVGLLVYSVMWAVWLTVLYAVVRVIAAAVKAGLS